MRVKRNKNTLAIHGGPKSVKKPFSRFNTIGTTEALAVLSVLKTGVLSQFLGENHPDFFGGPKVQEFEKKSAEYFGVKHAITVNSWTSGLICAVGAIGTEPGDEVILPPWTMSATAMAILHWNAIPIFADISDTDYCLDPEDVRRKITSKTRAIFAVDIFGNSAPMKELRKIADEYDLKLICDTAQSPGATYKGKIAGTLADIGGISLNYHKHIHTGEGGVLFTNDDELALRMKLIRNHGESVVEGMGISRIDNIIGYNFRLGEIEAAIGMVQLGKLSKIISKKQLIANALTGELKNLPGLVTPKISWDLEHVYYIYPLQLVPEKAGFGRSELVNALRAEGLSNIGVGYRLIHTLPIFRQKKAYGNEGFPFTQRQTDIKYELGQFPVAERLHNETFFCIGITGLDLSNRDVRRIGQAFRKVWMGLKSNG